MKAMAYHAPGNGSENGGAWPKGRRRHPDSSMASIFVGKLRGEGLSWNDISGITEISVRMLRKYNAGTHYPSPDRYKRIVEAVAKFCGWDP